jgi:hypothetical protein
MTGTAFKFGSMACQAVINSSYCYDYAAMATVGYALVVILGIGAIFCVALQKGTG